MAPETALILVPVITGVFGWVGIAASRRATIDRQRLSDESAAQHDVLLGHVLTLTDRVSHGVGRIETVAQDLAVVKEDVRHLKMERV